MREVAITNASPQGGVHAYVLDRGRAWVESINSIKETALIRWDAGLGKRSRCYTIQLSQVDFTRQWKF